MRETPYAGCPPEETLQELAAGISPVETAEVTAEHAAHCDFCGPRLSRYLKEFSEPWEAEDAAILEKLDSSKSKWQKQFVHEHVLPARQRRGWSIFEGFWPRMAVAGAGAGVAIAVALFIYLRLDDLAQAQKLVATAYSERRTTEMRFPSAPFASYNPVPVVKGGPDGGDWKSAPASLVEAESLLKQKNKSEDLSPQWLQVQGRIDLLQGSPRSIEEAVDAFEKALAKDPENLGLKIDLATAYFEKEMGADHDRPVLIKTIDLLNDVIKNSRPTDTQLRAVAWFDLAIAYEKSAMRDLAVDTWSQYLQLDKTSDWAKEARRRLETLQKGIPAPKKQGYRQPAFFLKHLSDPQIQDDTEQYHEIALGEWIAEAIENPLSDSSLAVHQLAVLFAERHRDGWWRDFLDSTQRVDLPGVRALEAAFTANGNDLHYQAIEQSRRAAILFAQRHNEPGKLLARFQEVYALQRILLADECIAKADQLSAQLSHTDYHWLQGQLALEKATCANWISDFRSVAINVEKSIKLAAAFYFPELNLRVMGLDAGMKRQQSTYDAAWQEVIAGLRLYWEHSYSSERLYQFYIVASKCSAETSHIHASEALLRQSINIFEQSSPDDSTLTAMLYLRLANLLLGQGHDSLAELEASKARLLLREIPANERTAQRYSVPGRIEMAKFELSRGRPEAALATIAPMRDVLNAQDNFISLDFYAVLGNIKLQLKQLDEAEKAYARGIQLAERSIHGLEDDASRLPFMRATDEMYRGLVQVLLAQKRDAKALALWEWSKSRTVGGRTEGPDDLPALPEVSEKHLIYASFQDRLQVWTIQGREIRSHSIPIRQSDLRRLAHNFGQTCGNPNSEPEVVQKQAEELYSLLLDPLIAELAPSRRMIVELDEPISTLTMEALRIPAGHYVGEVYSVAYSPGVLVETALRAPGRLRAEDTMLLVDASQSDGGAPLPGHADEVSAVKGTFAKTRVLGPAIDLYQIKQALTNSTEFHFSGHGKPDGTGTALVIGSDSSLRARDLSPDRLQQLQLAVLSACSSGSARKGPFDESNLVRSFLAGGVPTIIASRWNVDSKSTSLFMRTFYDHLRSEPPVQALQYAQAEMRSAQSHPYYWAAFTLTGRVN